VSPTRLEVLNDLALEVDHLAPSLEDKRALTFPALDVNRRTTCLHRRE
jgi:hypothetical protein